MRRLLHLLRVHDWQFVRYDRAFDRNHFDRTLVESCALCPTTRETVEYCGRAS